MILSSLLLVEGHDLTGKGTFRKCGLAIKMAFTSGFETWIAAHRVKTTAPYMEKSPSHQHKGQQLPGQQKRLMTRDFKAKFQRKRET